MSSRHGQPSEERKTQSRPPLESQPDSERESSSDRPPIWLVVVVILLVAGFVALHLTGVVGPGSH